MFYAQPTQHQIEVLRTLREVTATISYCYHTNVKIAVGTHFHNSSVSKRLVKSTHPVFALEPLDLITLIAESKTPTEKYLSTAALLINSGLLNTSRCGLYWQESDVEKVFKALIRIIKPLTQYFTTGNKHQLTLPTLMISRENNTSGDRVAIYLKEISKQLHLYYGNNPLSVREKNREKLEDELALELELNKILNAYNLRSSKYTPKLGQWAIKQMRIKNDELTSTQVEGIRHYLNSTNLDRLSVGTLQKVIALTKNSLPYDDDVREQSLLVIRHLEAKLETIHNIVASLDFITIADEEQYNRGANVKYTTKTKVQDMTFKNNVVVKVANTKPIGESPLARMLNKYKATTA